MKPPQAHHTRFHIRAAIATHRTLHERDPARVEIGLMEMRGMEEANGKRLPGQPLVVDEVPVTVGSLADGVKCVRS